MASNLLNQLDSIYVKLGGSAEDIPVDKTKIISNRTKIKGAINER